jgi:hypothetical protein
MWRDTLWLAVLRSAGAGVVWALVAVMTDYPGNPAVLALIWPLGYFILLLPLGLATAWLSKLVPFVGLFAGMIALFVAVGDPLVFVLSRFKPISVPVERPRFFQFQIIVFVMSPFDR